MSLLTGTGKPRVVLGTMTFGPDADAGARVTSLDEYNSCLDYLQSQGYNEIDTARAYVGGKQEAWTKDANWKDRGLTLATKCYPAGGQTHKPEDLRKSLETSLKELGTDCVDYFYLHAADRSTPFEDTLRELDKMHKEGKFVNLAISNFTAYELAEVVMTSKANGWVRPTLAQYMYNPITRSIDPELVTACRRYGLDIVIYNPIAGGLFSGKYKAADMESAPPAEGRFSDKAKSGAMYRSRYFKSAIFESIAHIEPVVEKHNLTMIETALRWCRHHSALKMTPDGNDGIIIGVSSQKQLESNLKDIEKGPLPEEVVQALDEAWKIAKRDTPNYWHMDLKYTYDPREALFGNKS